MKREDRKQVIMDLLVQNGAVELEALARRFSVSKMTIHRDLDDLEAAGVMRKVRGGGTIDAGTQFESDFRFRAQQDHEAKERMAQAALALIDPGMTVMINDGSMAAILGARLHEKSPLTVITNNAAVIAALQDQSGITLIATGGTFSSKFNGYFGVVTEMTLAHLRADIAFISAPAVNGFEVFHMDDSVVKTKQGMVRSASKTCLLVNHSRFGRTALYKFAELTNFDVLITDETPDANSLEAVTQSGLELVVA